MQIRKWNGMKIDWKWNLQTTGIFLYFQMMAKKLTWRMKARTFKKNRRGKINYYILLHFERNFLLRVKGLWRVLWSVPSKTYVEPIPHHALPLSIPPWLKIIIPVTKSAVSISFMSYSNPFNQAPSRKLFALSCLYPLLLCCVPQPPHP